MEESFWKNLKSAAENVIRKHFTSNCNIILKIRPMYQRLKLINNKKNTVFSNIYKFTKLFI